MVRLGGARLRALGSFCTSLSTRLVLPPLFDSKLVRLFLNQKESTMTISLFSKFHFIPILSYQSKLNRISTLLRQRGLLHVCF